MGVEKDDDYLRGDREDVDDYLGDDGDAAELGHKDSDGDDGEAANEDYLGDDGDAADDYLGEDVEDYLGDDGEAAEQGHEALSQEADLKVVAASSAASSLT